MAGQQRKSDKGVPRYQITGVAVSAKDGSVIPRCHLAAQVAGGRSPGFGGASIQTDADDQGRFALDVPSDGTWSVVASARGYRRQEFDEHDGFFTGVVLTRTSPSYDLVFRVAPDGVIRGTVTDEAGEPVRGAQVRLFTVHPEARATDQSPLLSREFGQTDDLGQYEFAELAPGEYEVEVQAHPWYAVQRPSGPSAAADAPSDPSLDVVYPVTWYPGVDDDTAAEVLTMHSGEVRQADMRLRPLASAHLLIPIPNGVPTGRGGGRGQPVVSQVMPDGSLRNIFAPGQASSSGMFDIGGLQPGTYQVSRVPGGDSNDSGGPTSIVHVGAGGSTTEVTAAASEVNVTIAVDGGTSVDASEIRLRDTSTGRVLGDGSFGGPRGGPEGRGGGPRANQPGGRRPQGGQDAGGRGQDQRGRGRRRGAGESKEATLSAPPGEYEVVVPGGTNAFLTGLVATGAQAKGRVITIREGAPHLLIHLASGLAKVTGTAKVGSNLSVGAMVLLVPATLGDPSSLTIVRRDQSNTDGGFRMDDVIPGQYILLAIEHGWEVKWTDPATLAPYLLRGVPVDLASSPAAHPVIQAVSP
ncbi:carboxypeptidase-like regulatory domain-containing protein [Granulicella sibirica]|uniref:carboxypeptidase-like regulatory domain-containing protein n=1 Tax=Granulicella sibirica TaxID=2479048 RepID=UPI001375F373|nr:carboxypeptidase-like regulatory domain-containing protein [Granulicella sibirica]